MAKRARPTHYVFFGDEVKAVGNGFRGITVKQLGRKWAHLQETASGLNFRLPLQRWLDLERTSTKRMVRHGMQIRIPTRGHIKFEERT